MNYSALLQKIAQKPITEAEMKVALLSLDGNNSGAIAQQLYICRYTVKTHLKRIYRKCEVSNQPELIAKVLQIASQRRLLNMANTLRLDRDRYQKLQEDRRKEVLYANQRQAISQALQTQGKRLYKLSNRPIFELNDPAKTRIRYINGAWQCDEVEVQQLINSAIAGVEK